MSDLHGSLIWYELMTPDPIASADFYQRVVGWTVADGGMDNGYRMIRAGEADIGGMLPLGMAMPGAMPAWLMYVGVDNVAASVAAVAQAGGRIIVPPQDVLGYGRFALVTDPQGAMFYMMTPIPPEGGGTSSAFDPRRPGRASWNELETSDLAAALAFYRDRFGWTQSGSMPMGPAGDYIFLNRGEVPIGAAMAGAGADRPPAWRPYFRVVDIDAAVEAIRAGGGTVNSGPHEVPGGDRVITATDPLGARLGFVATAQGERG